MKKVLSILLVALLCFGMLSVTAAAANESIVVSVKGGTAQQGGTITVPISLSVNAKGFTTLGIQVSYDSNILEIVCPEHQDGKNCKPSIVKNYFVSGNQGANSQYHTVNPYIIQWAYPVVDGSITKNVTKTGELAKITFKVKNKAKLGATKIKVVVDQAAQYNGTRLTVKGGEATVNVVCATHTYDNNCDAYCNVCNTKRTAPHTYTKKTTEKATVSKNGYILTECSVCGADKSKTTIYYPKTIKLSATAYTYNGKARTPAVTVKDSAGKTLKKNTDYTVTYSAGRINAGTYKVTVKFKGNYSGSKTLSYKVNPASTSKFKISLSGTSYTYNGKVKKPAVTVKDSANKKLSTANYTVTYQSGRKNVGKYKVTIKFKGNYSGSKALYFNINPPKTTVSKLVAGKKSATVYITKKSAQVTGYQIQYATNKKFTSAKTKTISSYKTTKVALSGLSAKKYYYVRVRTFKTVGGKHYYSGWSTLKYVKTK